MAMDGFIGVLGTDTYIEQVEHGYGVYRLVRNGIREDEWYDEEHAKAMLPGAPVIDKRCPLCGGDHHGFGCAQRKEPSNGN